MITYLRMTNFRRHKHTEIRIDSTDQLIFITGENGAGKSTILEAIHFALWGEGRIGRRNLDGLIARGVDHKPMVSGLEVELEFEANDTTYRVIRKRTLSSGSAMLFVQGQPDVEGPAQVTQAVSAILGVDAAGFKLAVTAQQKELDSLTKLGPTVRAKALSRLLRLDAVTRARDDARDMLRRQRTILEQYPSLGDPQQLADDARRAGEQHAAAQLAEKQCRIEIDRLSTLLDSTISVQTEWQRQTVAAAKAEASVTAAQHELDRAETALAAHVVPTVPADVVPPVEEIRREMQTVEQRIAAMEAAERIRSHHQSLLVELGRIQTQLDTVTTNIREIGDLAVVQTAETGLHAQIAATQTELVQLQEQRDTKRSDHRVLVAELEGVQASIRRVELLGAECDACGQGIPHEHKTGQLVQLQERFDSLSDAIGRSVETGQALTVSIAELDTQLAAYAKERDELGRHREQLAALTAEQTGLRQQIRSLQKQADRSIPPDSEDPEAVFAERGRLEVAAQQAEQIERARTRRDTALARLAELNAAVADAKRRLEQAQRVAADAVVSSELADQYQDRQRAAAKHIDELDMLAVLTAATAEAAGEEAKASLLVEQAATLAAQRADHERDATTALDTHSVLADADLKLAESVKPSLEGAVATLLDTMSSGRFSKVQFDANYDIKILDDGQFRALTELSGGEQDLVALALRLGLANVLSDRHDGNIGFLILDEVFGSQDAARRESIITALRTLRTMYQQIWCISHVGGLDEHADRILTVERDEDDVTVS